MRDTNNTREEERNGSSKHQPQEAAMSLKLIDSCLRLSVIPLSVATIWLTITIHQSNSDYGNLDYNSIMGLKYMVGVSAICGIYALLSIISLWVTCLVSKAWLFFVPDQVLAYLMTTSVAGATEIVYLLNKGDKVVTWSESVDHVLPERNEVAGAIALSVTRDLRHQSYIARNAPSWLHHLLALESQH